MREIVDAINAEGRMPFDQLCHKFGFDDEKRRIEFFYSRVLTIADIYDSGGETYVTLKAETLAEYGLQPREGDTRLTDAAKRGHTEVGTMLLAAYADVNQADENGNTPLILACEEGHTEFVTKLLGANADVHKANIDGRTALHLASKEGHVDIVKTLIYKNAVVYQADHLGVTPLHLASFNDNVETITALVDAGADMEQADNEASCRCTTPARRGTPGPSRS